jgi:hypothetical protein
MHPSLTTRTRRHLIVSEDEQLAIVNALAFVAWHFGPHTDETPQDTLDERQWWRTVFHDDNAISRIDDLATKIAQVH